MDKLVAFCRAELAVCRSSGDPWDAGWLSAIEAVVRLIPDFPDPPPAEPPVTNDREAHIQGWVKWGEDMKAWRVRNTVSDLSGSNAKP